MITEEQFKRALPQQLSGNVNQEVMASINLAITDPQHAEAIRENVLSYTSVMNEGRFKITDYVNAVKFNSYRLMGDSNIVCWAKTFPDKYQKLKVVGATEKTVHAHVAMYNKTKLVNLVFEQTLIPTHILNAGIFQDAINTQASIMKDQDVSPKVRSDAANSLLTHLKRPEAQKVELDVAVKDDGQIAELKQITLGLAAQQRRLIEQGVSSVKDVSNQGLIIEGEKND